jgi:hypothetical protein
VGQGELETYTQLIELKALDVMIAQSRCGERDLRGPNIKTLPGYQLRNGNAHTLSGRVSKRPKTL